MKFKDLPEGHYFIHAIGGAVSVQQLENPDTAPKYVLELETIKVVRDGRSYRKNGMLLDDMEVEYKTYEEMRKERKSRGASYGHVTRRILAKEPLKGKTLELAIDLVTPLAQRNRDKFTEFRNGIVKKLQAGQPFDDYESRMLIDMILPHGRL